MKTMMSQEKIERIKSLKKKDKLRRKKPCQLLTWEPRPQVGEI